MAQQHYQIGFFGDVFLPSERERERRWERGDLLQSSDGANGSNAIQGCGDVRINSELSESRFLLDLVQQVRS